jgi:hypothetical protein
VLWKTADFGIDACGKNGEICGIGWEKGNAGIRNVVHEIFARGNETWGSARGGGGVKQGFSTCVEIDRRVGQISDIFERGQDGGGGPKDSSKESQNTKDVTDTIWQKTFSETGTKPMAQDEIFFYHIVYIWPIS